MGERLAQLVDQAAVARRETLPRFRHPRLLADAD